MKSNLAIALVIFLIGCKSQQNQPAISVQKGDVIDSIQVSPWLDYRGSYSRSFDLLHFRLNLDFNWTKRQVNGKATLYLRPYFYNEQYLTLDAKEFDLNDVALIQDDDTLDLQFEYDDQQIWIDFQTEFSREDTVIVQIDYVGNPYRNSGFDNKGLYFINHESSNSFKPQQIWTQGETEYNSRWFPTIDDPNEKCTHEIFLTVAEKFRTLSNGSLVWSRENQDGSRTDYWKMSQMHSPYLTMITVGEFSVVEDSHQNLPIRYWVEPEYADDAKAVFGNTPEMIEYFSDLLQYPFPWNKYDQVVVRDFVTGAMENTTASVFMEDLQVPKEFLIDDHWDGIISHELFHQWFGNLVTCESWSQLALNEALASYGEHLWIEYKYGQDAMAYHSMEELQEYLQEAENEKKHLIRHYYEDPEDMFDNHSYAKGARILHMLRGFVGDEAFFSALNHYLVTNEFRNVELHDLRKSFEYITGEDLNWFFAQWFLGSGHPELQVQHQYNNDTLYIEVEQVQDLEKYPLYYLPLYMDIAKGDDLYRYPLQVMDEYHLFRLPLESAPDAIIIDGDYSLVGKILHEKSDQEWLKQIQIGDTFQARYQGIVNLLERDSLNEYGKEAIKIGLEDESPIIQELVLSYFAYVSNEKYKEYSNQVKALTRHPDSKVRTGALIASKSLDLMVEDDWKFFLNDSSFLVKGLVLEYLLSKGDTQALDYFNKFRDSENINLLLPVGNYVNQFIGENYINWYLEWVKKSKSGDLFYILQLLNEYLLVAPEEEQSPVIDPLFALASQHPAPLVRLSAFQGLMIVDSAPGVSEKLTIIKALENDPQLIKIYAQY